MRAPSVRSALPPSAPVPGSPAPSHASSSASSSKLPPNLPAHLRPAAIVTRKDQAESLASYEGLLTASKAYTQALLALSSASNDFAFALQDCARLKGAHKVGSQLHAASGLEFIVASHSKLLADEFWKGFSIPLLEGYDAHRQAVAERQMAHEAVMADRSRELKECEDRNMRGPGRRKQKASAAAGGERDLGSFRRALEELQRLVDGIDEERAGHYVEVLAAEEEEWDKVTYRVSHLLRLQLEVHDRLSSKPLSDPILEPMLSAIPDPFGAYTQADSSGGSGGNTGQYSGGANRQSGSGGRSSSCEGDDDGGGGGGEIFSVLQHSGVLQDRRAADATLTPSGLLSPRAPAIGLPRAPPPPAASSSASSTTGKHQQPQQRDSTKAYGGASSPPRQLGNDSMTTGGAGGGGGISFAALGLTSASHPQSSTAAMSGSVSAASAGIGSPLFGSEDGSSGDRAGSDHHAYDDQDDSGTGAWRSASGGNAGGANFFAGSNTTAAGDGSGYDPKTPTKPKAAATTCTTTTAFSSNNNISSSSAPASASASGGGENGRAGGGGRRVVAGGAGLGRRLRKALSIINDNDPGEREQEGEDAERPAHDQQRRKQQKSRGISKGDEDDAYDNDHDDDDDSATISPAAEAESIGDATSESKRA